MLCLPDPITTPRLLLRIVELRDLPALMAINGNRDVTHFLPYPTWQAMADAVAWFERMAKLMDGGTALQFVLVRRSDELPIGTVLLFHHDEGSHRAEIGYVLGREFWGQGYMQEALHGLLTQAFGALGLRRLEAEVNPANVASTKLLQRLGFQREGLLRQRWEAKGEPYDVVAFGLLSHEHRAPAENGS